MLKSEVSARYLVLAMMDGNAGMENNADTRSAESSMDEEGSDSDSDDEYRSDEDNDESIRRAKALSIIRPLPAGARPEGIVEGTAACMAVDVNSLRRKVRMSVEMLLTINHHFILPTPHTRTPSVRSRRCWHI